MNTLEFLRHVLPDDGFYCAGLVVPGNTPNDKPQFRQKLYQNIQDLSDFVQLCSQRGFDTYYGISAFKSSDSRKQTNVLGTKLVALDLDVGKPTNSYASRKEALSALLTFVTNAKLPQPMIVQSGAGLHVYWVFTETLTPEEWRPLATAVKNTAISHGMIIDPVVTGDISRVLRPTGTVHVKTGRDVKVLLEADPVDPEHFKSLFPELMLYNYGTKSRSEASSALSAALSTKTEYPPVAAAVVVSKCQQLGWGVSHQSEVPEPFWYAMMGLAAYAHDAENVAISWSDKHPSYNEASTLAKLTQWKSNVTGPPTCTQFANARPKGCDGCPFKDRIRSPAQLASMEPEAPPAPSAPDPVVTEVTVPRPFKRTSKGMVYVVDDVDIDVCPFDIYPVGYGKDETLGYEVVRFHWNRPRVGWVELKLRQALLTEGHRDFPVACADQGIVLFNKKQTELFQAMLRSYMDELRKMRDMSNLYNTMGWKENFSQFVIGDTVIRKDDNGVPVEETSTLSTGISRISSDMYGVAGSLAEWTDGTQILEKANMPGHMFALSMGFAAPLFAFTGLKGMTVSLYGPTGGGKTLAQYWVQSIYGNPDRLHFAAKFTQNSLFSRLGMYSNLPMTIDEATMFQDKELGDFLYWVSQGRDKARLTRSAEERDAKTWATPVIVSTNVSLQAKLVASGLDNDAQAARLLEISIPAHKLFVANSNAGQKIYSHLMGNYGYAGREYIKELMNIGEAGIRKMIEGARKKFKVKYNADFAGQERFWEQAIILQDLGASIAQRLGIINYDYTKGTEWVLSQLGLIRAAVADNRTDAFDILGQFLNDMAASAVTVMHTSNSQPLVDHSRMPRGDVRVRFDLYRPAISSEFTHGVMLADRAALRRWLSTKGLDWRTFMEEITKEGADATPKNKRAYLGKDTPIKIGQTYVVGFDLTHPRLLGILSDADDALAKMQERKLNAITSIGKKP